MDDNEIKTQSEKPEDKLVNRFISSMTGVFFHISNREQRSDTGKRIDLIVYFNPDAAAGIEFKRNDKRKHGNELGSWLKQANGYSTMKFYHEFHDNWETIPVFVYPPITYTNLTFNPDVHAVADGSPQHEHNNVNSFIFSAFRIGEIRCLDKTNFIFSSNCYNIADVKLKNGKWKCYFHANKYRILMEQLNKHNHADGNDL